MANDRGLACAAIDAGNPEPAGNHRNRNNAAVSGAPQRREFVSPLN